jgi:hypothetical protein
MIKSKWLKLFFVLTLLIGLLPAAVAFAEDGVSPEVQGAVVEEGTNPEASPDSWGGGNFKFYGTVESLPPAGWYGTWTVSGRFVNVDMYTRIKGMPAVGSYVEVKGWLQANGSVNATEIEVKNGTGGGGGGYGGYTKFYGTVQVLPAGGWYGDWVVNGTTVHVAPTTFIKQKRGMVRIGAYVEVKGYTQPDGSVNAIQIEVKG